MDSVSIGLDIGSSAVRAAEVEVGQGRRVLRRYAQVGLPHGYVIDGEVINIPGVSAALKRLWVEGGFNSSKVVLGVAGPRVFVRQADVPALNSAELRSALKFDSQELIPIPMEDASFDFSVLESDVLPGDDGKQSTRILLVAAHRDLLRSHMAALKGAGLTVTAVDATPLALMRVAPPATAAAGGKPGLEVLVSIGAELTTVSVRDAGIPRFIRSLTIGGSRLTETIANTMHLEVAVAERLKRGSVPDGPHVTQARKAMSVELRDLAEDVRATVDFFMAQANDSTIDRLLITGGAAQTEGLVAALRGNLSTDIQTIDPFAAVNVGDLDLGPDALSKASASASAAIGLALWPVESPLIRLSVLPEEVAQARRARRLMMAAGCGVAGLAAVLGVATTHELLAIHSAKDQVHKAQAQVDALTSEVNQLTAATAVHGQVEARAQLVVTALQGDIDWVRFLGQLAAVMPPQLHLTGFSGGRTIAVAGSSSTAGAVTRGVGTLTFTVSGTGGLPTAAAWLEKLQTDHSLEGTWITGITVTPTNGGTVTYSSTADIATLAQSHRDKAVQQ